MRTIKGPAIFLAQFAGDAGPFNSLSGIARWAADHGYLGVQIPSWDARLFDLRRAAESEAYCDEVRGILATTSRSTASRHRRCAATRRRVPPGPSSNCTWRRAPRAIWA